MNSDDRLQATILAALDMPVVPEGTQIIKSPGWYQTVSPLSKEPSENEIRLSLISESCVDQKIDEAFSLYGKYKLPFKWAIGPMSSPNKLLEKRLQDRAADQWPYRGMTVDSNISLPQTEGVTVEQVSQANFSEYVNVHVQGWAMTDMVDRVRAKFEKLVRHPNYRGYMARKNNKAVASAATILKDGYGYLIAAVVLKENRGCGAYRALIGRRLKDLHQMDFPFAVTQARETTSAPILEKLGFNTVFHAKIFLFNPASSAPAN